MQITDTHARAPEREVLTDTAIEIGEEKLCSNVFLFGEWISEDDEQIMPCAFFGPISRSKLVREIMLNPNATVLQIAEAVRELRRRYLDEYRAQVLLQAERSMT